MEALTPPPTAAIAQIGARTTAGGRIVWLASYPKSGNTWLRSLITAYRQQTHDELDINALDGMAAASRPMLDALLGIATDELSADEMRSLLPSAFRGWSARKGAPHYLKIHDAYGLTRLGEPVIPAQATHCVLHLVRDPRDVAVSAMHHWGLDIDRTIDRLNDAGLWIATDSASSPRVQQFLSDWSGHTQSWLDCPLPRLTLRYEDLLSDPERHFEAALRFAGLPADRLRVKRAVARCALPRLQAQERTRGFVERGASSNAPFFRRGGAGGWRHRLDDHQAQRIVAAHWRTMRRMDYAFGFDTAP